LQRNVTFIRFYAEECHLALYRRVGCGAAGASQKIKAAFLRFYHEGAGRRLKRPVIAT
jgi:hypothetical protein